MQLQQTVSGRFRDGRLRDVSLADELSDFVLHLLRVLPEQLVQLVVDVRAVLLLLLPRLLPSVRRVVQRRRNSVRAPPKHARRCFNCCCCFG